MARLTFSPSILKAYKMTGDPYIVVFSRITMEGPYHSASHMGTSTYYIIQFAGILIL